MLKEAELRSQRTYLDIVKREANENEHADFIKEQCSISPKLFFRMNSMTIANPSAAIMERSTL
jgi:hypothetical protein